ncbi:Major facilitator superfamily domaingeneral substrate transporter [Penicillium sp. IBT 31633x]|nr:Major facilitator superfamily domaingeneral substrate transporter [Penicillium sp. IBT 31633x]
MGFFKNSRVYMLATVAYTGSFLFGYDTGVMGSVLELPSFKADFGLDSGSAGFSNSKNAEVSSNVVSLLTAGCFFGAIAGSFVNEKFGRRYSIMGFLMFFLIGSAVQTAAKSELSYMYGGRVIAGFGVGGMSAITPVFVSENCPPAIRGRVAGLFQEFLVIGVTIAYWLCYGVSETIAPTTKQWRIPIGFQLVPGGLMMIGMFFLTESPRWLAKENRLEEAIESLAYMRSEPTDSPTVLAEMAEIKAAVEHEVEATQGLTWKEPFLPGNRVRFLNCFLIMFWQQWTGTNSIGYYAPQLFQTVGVAGGNTSLFTTGIYGIVKVVATGIFLIIGIDKVGRRWSLIIGALWMCAMMMVLGGVLVSYPPNPDGGGISSASLAMIVMIYLYVIGYSASWGPIPWVYISEIFPTRLRAYGVGCGSATQWLFNFVVTKVTPAAISNLGWRTFIMFGVFCFAMSIWVFLIVRETKGRSLEEMDVLFDKFHAFGKLPDVETPTERKLSYDGVVSSDQKEAQDIRIEDRDLK